MASPNLPGNPPPRNSRLEWLGNQLPTISGLTQFLLITLLGIFAKCGVDDYARNIERTRMIKDLTETLTKSRKEANISSQNFALLTLDRLYTNPGLKWYQRDNAERQADDSLLFGIAEEMWRVRKASPTKSGDSSNIDQARLNLAARIMRHRDPARFQELAVSYELGEIEKVRSFADAPAAGVEQPFSDLPIAADRINPLKDNENGRGPESMGDTLTIGANQIDRSRKLCYIQFRGFPRRIAQQLQNQFQQQGWTAPGVERVDGKYGCSVRYYFATDAAKAKKALGITQDFLKSQNDPSLVVLMPLTNRKLKGTVPHGQIEVWISLNTNL